MIGALLKLSDNAGAALIFAGLGAGLLLGPWVAWRSYRRRAGGEFRVWPDRVEFIAAAGGAAVAILGEEMEEIAVSLPERAGSAGRIELRGGGRKIRLNEAWVLPEIAADLARGLVPGLVERAAAKLEQGETLEFRLRLRSVAGPALAALFCGGFLLYCLVQVVNRRGGPDAVQPRALTFLLLLAAGLASSLHLLRRRLGGGLLFSKTGLRKSGQDFSVETRWSSVVRCGLRAGALEIESDVPPETYRCPSEAPNALLIQGLVERLRG